MFKNSKVIEQRAIKFHFENQMPMYLKQQSKMTLVNQKVAFFKYEKYQKDMKIIT